MQQHPGGVVPYNPQPPYGMPYPYGQFPPMNNPGYIQNGNPSNNPNFQLNHYPGQHPGQFYGNQQQIPSQIFQNPLQPAEEANQGAAQQQGYANPYPKASFMQKPQGSGVSSLMNSFKGQDGSLDFNKMMNTAGQMMNAVNQVGSMVKGIGGFFKI
ncbi:hypothetical protein D9X91_11620 [Falsibacillus albus]|uniref:Spore coat protein n=2 Tax=Falsibacillus albus TaxID=2478915 RepID=A0A3L7K3F5_9BACI|nr:hypothetical protein D9X91_11620 [Falsibacillus albus]